MQNPKCEFSIMDEDKKNKSKKLSSRMRSKSFGFAPTRSIHHVKEFYNWEFEDDERQVIREWSRNRIKKMQGFRKSYHGLLIYSFHLSTIKSFIENFNIIVLIQMLIAGGAVYLFKLYNIAFEFHVALVVSPIVFPLAFSINTDFQRREKVLDDLANFKSSSMVWFFCVREWRATAELDTHWLNAVQNKVHSMMFNMREYLLTERLDRRNIIARYMYEDFSDISQLIERIRASKLPTNTAIVSRAIHLLHQMCLSFERLRVIREYRSPRSIRAFNKVLIFLLPIILSPYFVSISKHHESVWWCGYVIAVVVAGVFGALQSVQDKLDDPFDGMSEDDINLDTIDEWTFSSLDTAASRNLVIGRFHVSKDVNDLPTAALQRKKSLAEFMHKHEAASREEELKEQVDSSNSVNHKSSFYKRRTAKSMFRRSTRKTTNLCRSKTFANNQSIKKREERVSTSSHFTPELHPFADVLEYITGDTTITRKDQDKLRRQRTMSSRQNSIDEEGKDYIGNEKVYKPNLQKHSVVSIIKEIPLDDEVTTTNHKESLSKMTKQKKVSYADFDDVNDLKTTPATPSKINDKMTTTPKHNKIIYSESPTREPLLSDEYSPDSPQVNQNRFKLTPTKLRNSANPKDNDNDSDNDLQQIVVVNGLDGSYNGSLHNDVFS